ncbi:hypothetical protein SCUCBS95973_003312 [Sporothrix curviconia]|uniref:Family A G protein-coupled receptor-like protein n=1 Tax=Sporothrix curviconia TaxID=1260050 RepID=A0ABP0BEK5_9PEZI
MSFIQIRSNDALDINPPAGDQHLSVHGSNWLWAVTAVYILSFLGFFAFSFTARAGELVFHYIYGFALLVGSVSYFAMASDLGWSLVATSSNLDEGRTRQIFFAKYINWVVTFPAIVLALGLLSGISWATIVYQIFLSWFWVLAYLAGAYTATHYKWGFFTFGTVAWILLVLNQWMVGRASARRVGGSAAGVVHDYSVLLGWLTVLWLLYPVAWGLSDGGNEIGETAGFIFLGILDVLMLPVLAFMTMGMSSNWDYNKLNIAFTQYGRVPVASGQFPEKNTATATVPAIAPLAPATASAPATATPAGISAERPEGDALADERV